MSDAPTKLTVQSAPAPQSREPERWTPFDTLRREVDRLFDDFLPSRRRASIFSPMSWPTGADWALAPLVDVVEQDGAFKITAELPGIDPKNIEVKVSDGMLTIRGEKTQEQKEEKADYYMCERHYGSFQRSFDLPDSADADKTEASYANGVLTLTVPKSPKAKASQKTIEVKAA